MTPRGAVLLLAALSACGRRPPEPVPGTLHPTPDDDPTTLVAWTAVGAPAPGGLVVDGEGRTSELAALYPAGPVLLVLHPEGCDGCGARTRALAAAMTPLGVPTLLLGASPEGDAPWWRPSAPTVVSTPTALLVVDGAVRWSHEERTADPSDVTPLVAAVRAALGR